MATKLTGDALADKVKSKVDGQDVRIQGKGKSAHGAFKRLGVTLAAVAVITMASVAPASAGGFGDFLEKTTDRVVEQVERNVERSVERQVQKTVRGASDATVGEAEKKVKENTGGIVNTREGTRAVQQGLNKFKSVFKIGR